MFKVSTILLVILSSSRALAGSCEVQARQALAAGQHHLVITMEGLFGGVQGRAYRLAKQSQSGDNFSLQAYSHSHGASTAAQCAQVWKQIHGDQLRLSLIGHSLGGGTVVSAAEILKKQGIQVQDLIIFDGREGYELTCGDYSLKYKKPSNVVHATAFYQCGGMPGRSFVDGPGVNNIRMPAGPFAHVGLPATGRAQQEVARILTAKSDESQVSDETVTEVNGDTNNAESDSDPVVTPTAAPVRARPVAPVYRNKDSQPAWCFVHGARYRCTYKEASDQQSAENNR